MMRRRPFGPRLGGDNGGEGMSGFLNIRAVRWHIHADMTRPALWGTLYSGHHPRPNSPTQTRQTFDTRVSHPIVPQPPAP